MLAKKLLLSYITIIFIPLLILSLVTVRITSSIISGEINSTVTQTLYQASRNISNLFTKSKDIALLFSMNEVLQSNLSQRSSNSTPFEIEKEVTAIRNAILYASIIGQPRTTIEVYAMNKPLYPNYPTENNLMTTESVKDSHWFQETVNLCGKLYWHISNQFDSPRVSLSRVVLDVKNIQNPLAVISVSFYLDEIDSILSKIKLGKNGNIYMMDTHGNVLSSRYKDIHLPAETFKEQQSGIYYKYINYRKCMISYYPLAETDWILVGIIPVDELLQKVSTLKRTIYILTGLSLLIALFISGYLSYTISKPIINLANMMKTSEKGDLSLSVQTSLKGEIGLLYSSFNNMIQRTRSLIDEVYVSKILKKDAELKALQAQINPHFLYNTLDSINWLAIKYNAGDISKMVTSLANILRYSINKGESIISVEDELHQVVSYLNIQQVRYLNKFGVEFHIEEHIRKRKMIKLLLQPLVENAIIHGIETFEGRGHIEIIGYEEENQIIFNIISIGHLVDLQRVNAILSGEIVQDSYGIQNVNQRLKLTYGEDYGLHFSILNDKTIAALNIPIMNGDEQDA